MNNNAAKPGRWSLRFSLRWMLVTMAVLGGVFYCVREYLQPRLVEPVEFSRPIAWIDYSPERLEEALKSKRPVLICAWIGSRGSPPTESFSDWSTTRLVIHQKNVVTLRCVDIDSCENWVALAKQMGQPYGTGFPVPAAILFHKERVTVIKQSDCVRCDEIIANLLK